MDKVSDNNDNNGNIIRGKVLYYSTSQVASALNQSDSKIRYYTNVFDDILHIEISNKQRRYTDDDINKLKFIIELKDEGMTIKQIQEYCQQVDFDNSKEIQIKENNPLSIQTMAKALLEQQSILIEEMKQDLIKQQYEIMDKLQSEIILNQNNFKNDVIITIDENINNKMDKITENILNKFDSLEKELSVTKDMNEKLDIMRESMENRKEKTETKSLWKRIFNK